MLKKNLLIFTVMVFVLIFAVGVVNAAEYTLVFSNYASEMDKTSKTFRYFAERLNEKTGDIFKFRYFYSGNMGGPTEIAHLVDKGTIDFGMLYINYYPAEFPLNLVKSTPFTGFKPDSIAKAYDQLKEEFPEIRAEYDALNAKHLLTYASSATLGPVITKNEKLMSLDDLKGLRVRAAGRDAVTVASWGMVPVKLAWPEIYEGFVRGVVDAVYGVDFNTTLLDLNLEQEADYFMNPGSGTPGTLDLIMNKDKYESFPPDIQKAIDEAVEEAKAYDLKLRAENQTKAINKLLEAGAVYYSPPQTVLDKLKSLGSTSAYKSWVNDCVKAGYSKELAQEILDRYIELNKQFDQESNWKSIETEIEEIQAN
ncbi:MAG: TRAP transporter substrate-binding protein DctP [Halanaerobiales bacterium]|nr:TRAP transporter substrate-binding protein DctP [Halanaerobiales bacterium]